MASAYSKNLCDVILACLKVNCVRLRAGFSDPYCEVKVGGERKFTTKVKKKTLNPTWNEFVTLELPKQEEILEIVSVTSYSLLLYMCSQCFPQ